MLNTTEVAAPNVGKKRAFGPEQAVLDIDVDPKKRRYEGHGLHLTRPGGDSTDSTTTQPSLTASDNQACFELSGEQRHRGRTRWREGSEPLEWDFLTWHTRRSMTASFEDGPGEEKNHDQNSETGTAKSA